VVALVPRELVPEVVALVSRGVELVPGAVELVETMSPFHSIGDPATTTPTAILSRIRDVA
jgi:hypothetical protein